MSEWVRIPQRSPCIHLPIIFLQRSQSLGKLAHNVQRFDVQPSTDPNNLVIVVIGQVKVSWLLRLAGLNACMYQQAPMSFFCRVYSVKTAI